MERVLSDEEKFRKAEEIYNRRRNMNVTVPTKNLNRNEEKKELKRFRKMMFQILVCVVIYFSVYFIQNSNIVFSEDLSRKIEYVLNYDIKFAEKFNQFKEYMKNNDFFKGLVPYDLQENEITEESKVVNEIENKIEDKIEEQENIEILNENQIENVIEEDKKEDELNEERDSKKESEKEVETEIKKESETGEVKENKDKVLGAGGGQSNESDSDEEQMKKDAKIIKENFQITLPLRGTITSRYGKREIEPKFHTGIDIARNTGSEIISATNGTVILAEEQKAYGKVLKIQNSNLVVLYAHCNELLVDVGDKISIKQKIATVGSTGNSTGPHLHFELIYHGRYVNPEYVLEFKE